MKSLDHITGLPAVGALIVVIVALSSWPLIQYESRPDGIRIAVASWAVDTCMFCVRRNDIEQFEHYMPPLEGDAVLELPDLHIQGFLRATRDFPDVELVGSYFVPPLVGEGSGSWVTARAWEKYSTTIVHSLTSINDLDGIYLFMHRV